MFINKSFSVKFDKNSKIRKLISSEVPKWPHLATFGLKPGELERMRKINKITNENLSKSSM